MRQTGPLEGVFDRTKMVLIGDSFEVKTAMLPIPVWAPAEAAG